jgi:hypothetical protein
MVPFTWCATPSLVSTPLAIELSWQPVVPHEGFAAWGGGGGSAWQLVQVGAASVHFGAGLVPPPTAWQYTFAHDFVDAS